MGTSWTWEFPDPEPGNRRRKQLELERQHFMRVKATCRATSKQSGEQCRHTACEWGYVCSRHGGKAPQVMRKAEERRRAAYTLWNETPESERHRYFPIFPVPVTDFVREQPTPKQTSTTERRKSAAKTKAEKLDAWPDPVVSDEVARVPTLASTWPPSTAEHIWGRRPEGRTKPSQARIERQF